MGYLTIENFKAGLDKRRSAITSQPGVLSLAQNGHITAGGEFEKRWKFLKIADAIAGTFGLQAVSDCLLTFGSVANPTPYALYPAAPTAASGKLPARAYRRLQDPIAGAAMTGVICSDVFAGKDFVIAQYVGGAIYAFYNGVAIPDSYTGVVGASDTSQGSILLTIAGLIARLPTALGFTCTGVPLGGATGAQSMFINGPSGFTVAVTKTSTLGTITQTPQTATQVKIDLGAGAWAGGDLYGCVLSYLGVTYNVSIGNLTASVASYCYTFNDKMYLLGGTKFYYSAIGQPNIFNSLSAVGNGFNDISSRLSSPDSLASCVHYQGKMYFLARRNAQIWNVPANPSDYQLFQAFGNTGTIAKLSVQPIGDLDAVYLSDTGVRSLRVRDISSNAITGDIGSPIDKLIQASLAGQSDATNAGACAIVDPHGDRYWVYLNGTIYVFTYLPTSKVVAWSTYLPTYETANLSQFRNLSGAACDLYIGEVDDYTKATPYLNIANAASQVVDFPKLYIWAVAAGGNPGASTAVAYAFQGEITWDGALFTQTSNQTSFTPAKFVVYLGRIYCLTSDGKWILYGDVSGSPYFDNSVAILETPWLSANTPGTEKESGGLDVAASGAWCYQAGMSPADKRLTTVVASLGNATSGDETNDSSFEYPPMSYTNRGTHIKIRAISKWATDVNTPSQSYGVQTIASLIWHYSALDEKK